MPRARKLVAIESSTVTLTAISLPHSEVIEKLLALLARCEFDFTVIWPSCS